MKASALKNSGNTNKNENYPTPTSLVRKIVRQIIETARMRKLHPSDREHYSEPLCILDIGAGSGVWGIVCKQELEALGYSVHLTAIEIDDTILPAPEVDEWIQADFRDVEFNYQDPEDGQLFFDFIFSNPPFSLVYEVAEYANSYLDAYGLFTLLIGSNFLFAEKKGSELEDQYSPLYEIKLTRRPSFKHSFSFEAYEKENTNTSAKDYCIYVYGGSVWCTRTNKSYLALPHYAPVWETFRLYWEYEPDPLDEVLLQRPVSVQQALIREAAEAGDENKQKYWTFDDYDSRMAANVYGWNFYHAQPQERFMMARHCKKQRVEQQLWEEAFESVG
jgi:predicted RNA methylase